MNLREFMSAMVRVVGLFGVTITLQMTYQAQLHWRSFRPGDPNYQRWVAPISIVAWLAVLALIIWSKPIGQFLARGIEDRAAAPRQLVSMSSRELMHLGFKLTGIVLCVLALSDAMTTVAWWGELPRGNPDSPEPSIVDLTTPIFQLGLGIALVLAGHQASNVADGPST